MVAVIGLTNDAWGAPPSMRDRILDVMAGLTLTGVNYRLGAIK
jgi:hypothetical protein